MSFFLTGLSTQMLIAGPGWSWMDGDGWWSALWTVVVVVRGDAADSPDADAGSANNLTPPAPPLARSRARRIEHVNSAAADNGKRSPAVGSSRRHADTPPHRVIHPLAQTTPRPTARSRSLCAVEGNVHLFKSRPRFWPNAKSPTAESPAQYSRRRAVTVSSPAERVESLPFHPPLRFSRNARRNSGGFWSATATAGPCSNRPRCGLLR
ncbi:hypothetical protein GUJ93_ZPchr0006g45055 [Zizania palustris]|uniref:Secreted protein n=1 Tax=Zizania palustris TaxID=103762 RepID=A0A8J5W2L6_ZIZPA|nr:hypothetical protein GUJ93_ZPchr0006g45055 [Zizania palustris]